VLYGQYILDRKRVRRRRRAKRIVLSNCVGRQAAGLEFFKSSRLRRYVLEPYNIPTKGSGKPAWLVRSFRRKSQLETRLPLGPALTMALSEMSNFRMQATSATLDGLPARLRRW
jgi:hypothetical protein